MNISDELLLPFNGTVTTNMIYKTALLRLSKLSYTEEDKQEIGKTFEVLSRRFQLIFYAYQTHDPNSKPELSIVLLCIPVDGFLSALKNEVRRNQTNPSMITGIMEVWVPMVLSLSEAAQYTGNKSLIKAAKRLEAKLDSFITSRQKEDRKKGRVLNVPM